VSAAITLYDRKRFSQSSLLLEHALAKGALIGVHSKAFYYLGLSYVEQGKRERAGVALTAFLDRAAVRDVDAYRKAESTLKSLGVPRRPCVSTEPVDLHW
jgi:Tfp pilus assembly protein PilF